MPQGSVLGPVLFIVYSNDISDCVLRGSKMKLFADDAKVYTVIDDLNSQAMLGLQKVLTLSWLGLDTGSLHCLNLNVLYCICLSVLIILACVNIILVTICSL